MKRWLVTIGMAGTALFLGVLLVWGQGRASSEKETKKDKRTINSAGMAVVKARPDAARVFFGVQTITPNLKEGRAQNAAQVQKVMDALKALHIPNLKMKSSDVQVELIQTTQRQDQLPQILGYRVTHTFTVLVSNEDAEKLGTGAAQVLDTALENGANIVQQIVFFKSNLAEVQRQALTRAVEDATANAWALAEGAKVHIEDTVAINGEPTYGYGGVQMAQTSNTLIPGEGGAGETPLVAGDLEVTCRVNVTCTY